MQKLLEWLGSADAMKWLMDLVTSLGGKLLFGILILVVGLFIIRLIKKFIKKSHKLDKLDPSLRSFISSFASIALYIVVDSTTPFPSSEYPTHKSAISSISDNLCPLPVWS